MPWLLIYITFVSWGEIYAERIRNALFITDPSHLRDKHVQVFRLRKNSRWGVWRGKLCSVDDRQTITHNPSSSPSPHLCALLPRFPYLRLSQAVQVGDVEHTTHSSGVYTACAPLLQTQVFQDLTQAGILGSGGEELFRTVSMQFDYHFTHKSSENVIKQYKLLHNIPTTFSKTDAMKRKTRFSFCNSHTQYKYRGSHQCGCILVSFSSFLEKIPNNADWEDKNRQD